MEEIGAKRRGDFIQMSPLKRMFISVLVAGSALFFLWGINEPALFVAIATWCTFALSYLISTWVVIFSRSTHAIRKIAKVEDGSRVFVLIFILVASIAAMGTVFMLVIHSGKNMKDELITVPISFLSVLLSWALVHTLLTFHYAHLYYNDDPRGIKPCCGGLIFPGDDAPDYRDFAYFSFVVGMTFQVSDVQVTDKRLRRLVLAHGMVSFVLNTFVVALTVNFIAGLKA